MRVPTTKKNTSAKTLIGQTHLTTEVDVVKNTMHVGMSEKGELREHFLIKEQIGIACDRLHHFNITLA